MNPSVLSRAQGCLLGQLAGDSLGALVEFKSPTKIRALYPEGCRDMRDGGTWNTLAGQPTDDSEMALMLARTLVREGRHDRGAVLDAYVHWFTDPQTFDTGSTIGKALGAASRGKTREERLALVAQHADPTRPSNGSLMRISPLGIFTAGRPDLAATMAREDSRLTHPHPAAVDACAVYVAAIAAAIANGGGSKTCYAVALAEASKPDIDPGVREAVENARHSPPSDFVTLMGWVLIALQNAFYQMLHAPNLEEGIVDTVMRGGDTDTTAAIAGALLGAVHGRQAVPDRWQRVLLSCRPLPGTATAHPRAVEYWPVDALELAGRLLLVGFDKSEKPG